MKKEKEVIKQVPQFKVRSDLTAGESVEACLKNVEYWKNDYLKRCAYQ